MIPRNLKVCNKSLVATGIISVFRFTTRPTTRGARRNSNILSKWKAAISALCLSYPSYGLPSMMWSRVYLKKEVILSNPRKFNTWTFFMKSLHRLNDFTSRPHYISVRCWAANQLSRQAMRFMGMGRSMNWTVKDNTVNCLFLCTTLTSRRRIHTRQRGTYHSCGSRSGNVWHRCG